MRAIHTTWPILLCLVLAACGDNGSFKFEINPPPEPESEPLGVEVQLDSGRIRGQEHPESAVWEWLAIPFAAPPTGELRWKAPRPVAAWEGTRDAVSFGPACPQLNATAEATVIGDEDCLHLNLWRPRSQEEIIVYIERPVGTDVKLASATMQLFESELLPVPEGVTMRSTSFDNRAFMRIEFEEDDWEGRVVLADALHLATHDFSPRAVVDLATLTGACMVALGPWATGLFSNDDDLRERLRSAGDACGERAWPLPLLPEHHEAMRSQVADLRNTGGRDGGASTAAAFLAAFVGDTPWAHLDIAGTASSDKASPLHPVGATGVGVRLLVELLSTWKP